GALSGILNGVDTTIWNPATDPLAASTYTAAAPAAKAANRAAVLQEFGLRPAPGPLAIVVSRLTGQKGIDLIIEALPAFLRQGGALAVLGSGDAALEAALTAAAARWPAQVGLRIGYDEALSHRMFAGADSVIVPSRFEPCGLTQMYGLRYGTIPVVAMTGGLADSVIGATPASLAAKAATGISFFPVDALALTQAMLRLCDLYSDRALWRAMVRRAMQTDVGWERSARAYAGLDAPLAAWTPQPA